jgi:endothelin-converting enzyme/putative endopeptidase
LPGVHVDGKFTLGENIGDLGGVNAAYEGLQLYLKTIQDQNLLMALLLSNAFLSLGQPFGEQNLVMKQSKSSKTDPHSPGMYRAYVPIQNVDAFYDAFTIKRRWHVH